MGVDWGQVSVAQFAVRAATDEAAMAAAAALADHPKTSTEIATAQSNASSLAAAVVSKMALNGLQFKIEKIEFGYFDKVTNTKFTTAIPEDKFANAAQVTVSTAVDMSFASLFGVHDVTVRRKSRAGAGVVPKRAADLVIVQDVTGSMSAADIANSKVANKELVDCIQTKADKNTRGAMVKFQNADATVVPLQAYKDAPGALYNAAAGISPSNSYSGSGMCYGYSGGCTTHSTGIYSAVDILNKATEPPEGIGQAIIIITDGAPWANMGQCLSMPSTTPYQKWVMGTSPGRCGNLNTQTTQTGCTNVGGRWVNDKCYPTDNGAESSYNAVPGTCSKGTSYTTESRCEGAGGVWYRAGTTIPNPSSLTRWTDEAMAAAQAGVWRDIDVYAVFYSDSTSGTYKSDALAFMNKHLLNGKGKEVGVLDAPSGAGLVSALQALCEEYATGSPGLID